MLYEASARAITAYPQDFSKPRCWGSVLAAGFEQNIAVICNYPTSCCRAAGKNVIQPG